MRTNPVTAIGYVRVSTVQQSEGWGLAAQRHRIEAYCAARGWDLTEICEDDGVSTRKVRPAFDHMLARVTAEGIGHVIVVKLDRAGRSALDLLRLYETLEALGTSLVSIEEGIDTSTPVGRFLRTILAAVAELERDMVSERTRSALAEAKRQGIRIGRPVLISPETSDLVSELRRSGLTLRAISAELESRGVPAPMGGSRWSMETVRKTLARR